MKKNTVIRSDSPHTVKMQAGSNVAQRKPAAKDKLHDAQAHAPTANIQHLPAEPPLTTQAPASPSVSKPKRTKAQVGKLSEAVARRPPVKAVSKTTNKTQAPSIAKTGRTSSVKTAVKAANKTTPKTAGKPNSKAMAPKPASTQKTEAPAASIWEEGNPIQQRLALLRIRNAELEEQIQRLNQTMPARGKRP